MTAASLPTREGRDWTVRLGSLVGEPLTIVPPGLLLASSPPPPFSGRLKLM